MELKTEHFDLAKICRSGQCFRMAQTGEGSFRIIAGDRLLRATQQGSRVTLSCTAEEFATFWQAYLDLDEDYGAFAAAVNPRDSYLMAAMGAADGVRILRQDLWEMIVTFLISQQNNIPRITRCVELLCRAYGRPCVSADGEGYYAFPEPEALAFLPEDALMPCNLGYRSKYVVRTARDVAEGRLDLARLRTLPVRKAKAELLNCFGVGEKVADCVCLFALHDLDAFPVDTHIRAVLAEHYRRGFPNRRYKGFRGVLQQYIFYYELHGTEEAGK